MLVDGADGPQGWSHWSGGGGAGAGGEGSGRQGGGHQRGGQRT